MKKKLLALLTAATIMVSSSATAMAATVSNGFLGATYTYGDDQEIGYSYVDSGYGYFEYIYQSDTSYNESVTIIANDLNITDEVTDEELATLKDTGITVDKVSEWFSTDVSEISNETINDKEYFVLLTTIDGEERVYYITYDGTVEYQFSMPGSEIADAELIREVLATVAFNGADSMIPINSESVDLYFEDLGAGIEVPDFSVYYYRGMEENHPNFLRSYEVHDELMSWMEETNTYAYILSDDVYDEIHLYEVDSYKGINLNKSSDAELEEARETMADSFEGQGHTVGYIDTGIFKTDGYNFIALQIADANGYDSQYYYTSDGDKGYVLECFYYVDQADEDFLGLLKSIVTTFYIGDSPAGAGSGSPVNGASTSASGGIGLVGIVGAVVGVAVVAIVVISMKKKKAKAEETKDDLFS